MKRMLACLALAVSLAAAPSRPGAEENECARVCKQDEDARKKADLVFLSTGRLIQGSTQLAATSSVKVGVVEMNPFRFEYRVDVTAAPKAAGLALGVFGQYAPPLTPFVPSAGPWTAPSPAEPGKAKKGLASCPDADRKTVDDAAREAEKARTEAVETFQRLRGFLDDVADFERRAKTESLPASACQLVCAKATSLRVRRDEGDAEAVEKVRRERTEALKKAKAAAKEVASRLPVCAEPLGPLIKDIENLNQTLAEDWPALVSTLAEAKPRLERLQQIIAAGLGPSAANQEFRDQPLPGEASLVTVRISRTDLWQEGVPEPVVTSSDVSVGRSRFSFSLGLGVTGLPDRRAIRTSAPGAAGATRTVFAYDTNSTFSPTIVGLLNAGILDFGCGALGRCGVAISAGVQPASDPKRLRYLAAASFSTIDGAFLVSLGAAIGQVEYIAGGFSKGQVVPDGVLEVPVRQDWQVGWLGALTYRIQ